MYTKPEIRLDRDCSFETLLDTWLFWICYGNSSIDNWLHSKRSIASLPASWMNLPVRSITCSTVGNWIEDSARLNKPIDDSLENLYVIFELASAYGIIQPTENPAFKAYSMKVGPIFLIDQATLCKVLMELKATKFRPVRDLLLLALFTGFPIGLLLNLKWHGLSIGVSECHFAASPYHPECISRVFAVANAVLLSRSKASPSYRFKDLVFSKGNSSSTTIEFGEHWKIFAQSVSIPCNYSPELRLIVDWREASDNIIELAGSLFSQRELASAAISGAVAADYGVKLDNLSRRILVRAKILEEPADDFEGEDWISEADAAKIANLSLSWFKQLRITDCGPGQNYNFQYKASMVRAWSQNRKIKRGLQKSVVD